MKGRRLLSGFLLGGLFMLGFVALQSVASCQEAQGPAAGAPESPPPAPPAPDPAGEATGTAQDVPNVRDKAHPTLPEAMAAIGHNAIAINVVWTLVAGFLVMFMQAGFALVETGFCRAKNAAHTMSMNLMVYGVGVLGYWMCGFALQMGGIASAGGITSLGGVATLNREIALGHVGLFGFKGFFLGSDVYDVGVFTLFLFQMVFMDTAATIPTGALAERWKWASFLAYSFFMSMLVYPLFANWVWGGGWLARLGVDSGFGHGYVDFAGSSVVHMVGGVASLAGAMVLGPRLGKYTPSGRPVAMPGHHLPMAIAGTFILAFGWFGFNAGSSLAGTDLRIGVIAVNTMLASAAGAVSAMVWVWWATGKPDPSMMANGMLAGLVAITAPCAFVRSSSAVVIGLVAGALVVRSVFFVERTLKVDDPVGAISVHGVNGAWGVIALGLFADGRYGDGWNQVPGRVTGALYGAPNQLLVQLIGAATCFVFVFAAFWGFFKVLDAMGLNRVDEATEISGLDLPEMGAQAYPEFVISPTGISSRGASLPPRPLRAREGALEVDAD